MKIPMPNFEQVAPEKAQRPARAVTQPNVETLQRGFDELDQAFSTGAHAYGEIQQKARAKLVTDAMTELHQGTTDDFYGTTKPAAVDPDAPTPDIKSMSTEDFAKFLEGPAPQTTPGYLATRGENAAAALDGTLKGIEKRRADIASKMPDRDTAELFLKASAPFMEESYKQAHAHAYQQLQVANDDSVKASLAQTLRSVTADPSNDTRSNELVASTAAASAALATSPADAKAKEDAVRAEVASTRLDVLLERGTTTDIEAAKRIFDESKHVLGEHRFAHYEGAIKLAQQKDGSEALASSLLERSRKSNGFVDETKAIADFAALPPESRTPALKAAFDHGLELAKKQEQGVKADKYNDALSAYLQRMNINDVPAATKMWMIGDGKTPGNDAPSWQRLLAVQHADREHAKGLGPTDAQRWAFAKLDVEMHDNPEKFKQMTPEQFRHDYWDSLNPHDRERAAGLFATARGAATKAENLSPAESNLLIEAGRKQNLFPQKGQPVGWDGEAADLYNYAKETLEKQKAAQQEPMKPGEMQKWIDRLMIRGKIPGTGILGHFQTGTTRLEAIKNDTGFEPEWSSEEKTKAASALLKKGLQPTDENIDSMLRIINGMQTRPAQAPELPKPPPTDAEVTNEYGLDLSVPAETPPIPDKKDLGLDF